MSDRPCPHCGTPMTLSQCWRLCCPANGGSQELLAVVDAIAGGTGIMKDGKRVDPADFYAAPKDRDLFAATQEEDEEP